MSKFLLNLLLQISKAVVNSKIQFLFENNFSSEFGPPGPASPVLARSAPQPATRACLAHPGLRGLGVFAKSRHFFEYVQPGDDSFFLCYRHVGPACQLRRLSRVGRPEARLPRTLPQLIAPRLPASIIATPIKAPYSPALIPPPEAPLTPSPTINGVGRKSPAVTHRHFLPGAPPAPIKGKHHPRVAPHLSPLLFPLYRPEQCPHRAPPPPGSAPLSPGFHCAARAPVRPEPIFPYPPLRFVPPPMSLGAPERPEAKLRRVRRCALCPRRCRSTVDQAHLAGPWIYLLENNSRPKSLRHFCKEVPGLL
jgi:hypothetical protein